LLKNLQRSCHENHQDKLPQNREAPALICRTLRYKRYHRGNKHELQKFMQVECFSKLKTCLKGGIHFHLIAVQRLLMLSSRLL